MNTTTRPPRPDLFPRNIAALPATLVARPQWGAAKPAWRGGKWTKVPVNPRTDENADPTNLADFGTLAEALNCASRHPGYGICFCIHESDPFFGVDGDGWRDPDTGALTPYALEVLATVPTYGEASINRKGIHLIGIGEKPGTRCRLDAKGLELYTGKRIFVFSGDHLDGTPDDVRACPDGLAQFYAQSFPAPAPPPTRVQRGHPPVSADDATALDRCRTAKNGPKFCRLYDQGDWEGEGYPSRSEARAAVCSMLGFWVNRDPARIERLFEASALYDEKKWARERTRVLALASTGEAHDWAQDAPPPRASSIDTPPLSTVDTPPRDDAGEEADDDFSFAAAEDAALADYRAMPHDALARLAFERGRRLDAIDDLLTTPDMSEVDKVAAYIVAKAAAVAQERQPDDAPTSELVINQKRLACDTGLSRQTFGKTLKRWTKQAYMTEFSRGTGKRTRTGQEIKETVIRLPARSFTDNLELAATWVRAADAKQQGGNGTRCPRCAGTARKKATETKTIETVTVSCADCGHVYHRSEPRVIGQATTTYDTFDIADTGGDGWESPVQAARRRSAAAQETSAAAAAPVSTVDPPPCSESDSYTPCGNAVRFAPPPPLSTVDTPGGIDWERLPLADRTGPPGGDCAVCGDPLRYAIRGTPLLCPRCKDERHRALLLRGSPAATAYGGAMAAGGG